MNTEDIDHRTIGSEPDEKPRQKGRKGMSDYNPCPFCGGKTIEVGGLQHGPSGFPSVKKGKSIMELTIGCGRSKRCSIQPQLHVSIRYSEWEKGELEIRKLAATKWNKRKS